MSATVVAPAIFWSSSENPANIATLSPAVLVMLLRSFDIDLLQTGFLGFANDSPQEPDYLMSLLLLWGLGRDHAELSEEIPCPLLDRLSECFTGIRHLLLALDPLQLV